MFIKKHYANGSFKCYKTCLITQDFHQHPGFEYLKVFASIVYLPTLCIVLAFAAIHDLHLWSIDISYTYLNGEIDCKVYMRQPKGFPERDPKELICLLKNVLYSIRQSGNHWSHKMYTVLESMGFYQIYSDATIYIYVKCDIHLILPVFVDDMTFAFKSLKTIKDAIQ